MLVLVNRQRLSHFESFPRITLHISIFFSLLSRRRSGQPARRRRPKKSLDRKNLESLTGSRHNIHFSYFSLISYLLFCSHHRCLLNIVRDDISKLPGCVQLLVRRGWLPKCGTKSKVKTCGLFLYFWKLLQKIVKKLDFLTSCEVAPERRDLPETKRTRRKRLSLNFECIFFVFTLSQLEIGLKR